MPVLHFRCYDTNLNMISQVWSGHVSLVPSVTSSVLATTWSGWDADTNVSTMNDVLRTYFAAWTIPSINPGKGKPWADDDLDRATMLDTWLRGSPIRADLSYAAYIGLVDDNDDGIYWAENENQFWKIGNDKLYTSVLGIFKYPILASTIYTETTNKMGVDLPFITSDGKAGYVALRSNKRNSSLIWFSDANSARIAAWYQGVPDTPSDPYLPGGAAGPGGGMGDWRLIDDPIDFPTLPTSSVAEAGFISIWVPAMHQLRSLSAFMWNADPLKVEFWKKMISNPIDLILGLHIVPFTIPTETDPANVTLGFIDSGIAMFYTDQQFHEVDCGELDLSEYWGAFLDYAPYTSLEIYLPFIGVRTLNINDCMPKTVHVKYYVDIVTGTCVALIKCGTSVFYHFSGSCSAQIPITSGQAQQLFGQALGLGISIATAAATGGVAGALAATVGASSTVASAGGMAGADRSGSLTGTAGFLDNQTPYLIVTRPRQAVPEGQNELTGYPSFIAVELSELTGYTEVQVTHLHNMSCTDVEVREIMQLLQEGVIF